MTKPTAPPKPRTRRSAPGRNRRGAAEGRPDDSLNNLASVGRLALGAQALAIVLQPVGEIVYGVAAVEPELAREGLVRVQEALAGDPGDRESSGLFIEISHEGRLVGGLLAVREDPGGFDADDWQTAGLIARQAADIFGRLEETGRALSLMRSLAEVETSAASQPQGDSPSVEQRVLHQARLSLGFDGGALYLQYPGNAAANLVCTDGESPGRLPLQVRVRTAGKGLLPEPGVDFQDEQEEVGAITVPLGWGEHLAGLLVLFHRAIGWRRPAFAPATLEMIGSRISGALGTAGLIRSESRQRRLAEALQEASQAIDRELELSEVLDRILEQVMRAFPCDAANFMNYEGEVSHVLGSRGYESFGLSSEAMQQVSLQADDFPNLRRLAAGEPVTVPDTTRDPSWVFRPRFEWLRSWAGVPVRYGDRILGFVMLDSASPGTFDESSTQRLMAFAAHAGAAMHNARLYTRLMQEHTRLRLVHTIGRRFSSSLQREGIIERLGLAVLEALGGDRWEVFFPSRKLPGRFEPLVPARFRGPAPALRDLIHEAWITVVADSFSPGVQVVGEGDRRLTAVAFPLTAGDRVHAVAVVGMAGEPSEPESWLDVLRPVGHQAGLALANAEEHALVQRRLAELTALQSIVRQIAGRLEVEAVLREVTLQLNTNLGFPLVQVFMRQGEELVLHQSSGPGTMVNRVPIGRGIVGRAALHAVPQFVPDVRQDPDYVHGLVGTRAEAAMPILAEGRVIGVLNVETSEPEQLDRDSLELLILLADQLSIAIQNASLYEAAQTNLEVLEARVRERTAQLEQVLEQAVAAERVKAQFVADVSHELRTPLTNIGLYLDLLDLSAGDRRAEYMATLRRETDRLGRLIEQLLAMSHLDTGQAELNLIETDLNGLVKVLVGDRARLISRKGLRLELRPDPELPLVPVDPQYLMQVMTNLLSNAVNYTPESGRITIETGRASWEGNDCATLTVRDTGPGIPPEERDHIFDRFYRGLTARASGVSGTGLGLAICRDIVTLHRGRLTIDSQVGEGSAFTVWLPLVPRP